jgi:hypothetical protein
MFLEVLWLLVLRLENVDKDKFKGDLFLVENGGKAANSHADWISVELENHGDWEVADEIEKWFKGAG